MYILSYCILCIVADPVPSGFELFCQIRIRINKSRGAGLSLWREDNPVHLTAAVYGDIAVVIYNQAEKTHRLGTRGEGWSVWCLHRYPTSQLQESLAESADSSGRPEAASTATSVRSSQWRAVEGEGQWPLERPSPVSVLEAAQCMKK